MYFHIDESGNTGNNLFDQNQSQLTYGVLSSLTNVDALGGPLHARMLKTVDASSLHANELGVYKLAQIAPLLVELQNKMRFDFDHYFIEKPFFALVMLFEAVFDVGLNEAVKWEAYWTPLRFMLLYKLGCVVDEPLLQEAWRLCQAKKARQDANAIVVLLEQLRERMAASMMDDRSKEQIVDALAWGIANPLNLDFGVANAKMISPNAVGFQFVVSALARRLRNKRLKDASSIVIDRQSQFNQAQVETLEHHKLLAEGLNKASTKDRKWYLNHPLHQHLSEADLLHQGIPKAKLRVCPSNDSIGLQIVDVYLWITNKMLAGAQLPEELALLASSFLRRASTDGISLEATEQRFAEFERGLPAFENLTEEQLEAARRKVEAHRGKMRWLGIRPDT